MVLIMVGGAIGSYLRYAVSSWCNTQAWGQAFPYGTMVVNVVGCFILGFAVVQLCQQKGLAGATVTRCVEGYGAGHQLHTTRLLELSENLPVRIDIVDVPERVEPLLAALEGMIGEGLVTVCDVRIIRYLQDPKL